MPVLIALAAAALSYAPSCAPFQSPLDPDARTTDAARIAAAQYTLVPAHSVVLALTAPGWRLVWAQPNDREPGVFIFRNGPAGWRYLDAWGGVATDRVETLNWARGRIHMPPHLAACFADQLMKEGP